ncbi:MAG: hypothetical protein H6739_34690 [Alphaproteobacteria bacterium]|nr:hypothetical protein [Alphaproteobacteria bacterium]
MRVARTLYGDAFEARTRDAVAEAMGDWAQLNRAEQGFAIAHLLYLNLRAQASTQHALRVLTEAVEEGLDDALDALGDPEDEPTEELPFRKVDEHDLSEE